MNCRWIVLLIFLLSASCASVERFVPDTSRKLAPEKARELIESVKKTNELIFPYKAIGRITLENKNYTWSVRAAWMGAAGRCFRMEALGMAGQPFAKIICGSGKCSFYFISDSEIIQRKTSRRNLAPVTGIDIEVNDLLFLLGGGVSLSDYNKAEAYSHDPKDLMLVLKKTFFGTVEIISFDRQSLRITQVQKIGHSGLLYQADINNASADSGRYMPVELRISDKSGNRMRISVERFWTDIVVPESAFSHDLSGNRKDRVSP